MNNNVFMVSDASYSEQTKVAGIGVVDLYSGKKYSMSLNNAKGTYESELRALIYSVEIAIKNKYKHVVFVYDNKGLKLKKLIEYTKDKFQSSQFLWLKRVYTDEADKVASKARKLQEELFYKTNKSIKIKPIEGGLSNKEIFETFKSKNAKEIISICISTGTKKERKILYNYLQGKRKASPDTLIKEKEHNFFNFIYYLLPKKNKKSFCTFIKALTTNDFDVAKFKRIKKEKEYIQIATKIVDLLKQRKDIKCHSK